MAGEWYRTLQSNFGDTTSVRPPKIESPKISFAPPQPVSTKPQGFQPRGIPEAIRAEDAIPESIGGMEGLIDTGVRSVAYGRERGLALVDTLASSAGVIEEGGSLLDPFVEGVRGLPVVGEHLSNAGDLTMDAMDAGFKFVGGAMNSQFAAAIDSRGSKDGSDPVQGFFGLLDEFGTALATGNTGKFFSDEPVTYDDLEQFLKERGWTDGDFEAIRTGQKGYLDFGDKQIPEVNKDFQAINDFGTRMVLDPLNLLFAPSAVVSKLSAVPKALRIAKVSQVAKARHPLLTTTKAQSVEKAAVTMGQGSTKGVTQSGAATYIMGKLMTGTRRYYKASWAATGLQVGLNTADMVLNEDGEPPDGFLGDVFEFARKWGEHKPLSKNDLFAMYSLMKVPGRTIAERALSPVKGKINSRRRYGHQNVVAEMMHPELVTTSGKKAKDYSKAWAKFVEEIGGQRQAEAAMSHILRHALHVKNFLEGTPSFPRLFHVTSMAESGAIVNEYSRLMEGMVRKALEEGSLGANDIRRAIEDFTATRGGQLEDLTKGVKGSFRPEDFYHSWGSWSRLADATSRAFQDGLAARPGITADLVTTDDINWLLANLDLHGKKTISGDQLMDLLRSTPAVFNAKGGRDFARVLTRDGVKDSYEVAKVRKFLNEARDEAVTRSEYVATFENWEGLSRGYELNAHRANQRLTDDGKIADDINPDVENAFTGTVEAADAKAVLATGQKELGGSGIGVMTHLRNTPGGMFLRHSVPAALRLAGYGVRSAVDSVSIIRGEATPVLNMRLSANRPFQDGLDAIALVLERSGATRGTAVLRGTAEIKAAGLTENATELTYKLGKRTESQWDDIINKLKDDRNRVTINDTTGVVRILVPDSEVARSGARLSRADKLLGGNKVSDRVAYRDVVKGKGNAVKGSDYVTLKEQRAVASKPRRYHIAKEYIDLDVGGYSGARAQGARVSEAQRLRAQAGNQYSYRTDGKPIHSKPTRWESDNGGGVRPSSDEHLVRGTAGPTVGTRWQDKIRAAGITDSPHGGPFRIEAGDRVYATGKPGASNYGNAGVVVRASGEVIPWRVNRTGPPPADWGETLAEATREGTWARFIDDPAFDRLGQSPIDILAEHGYVPAVRGRVSSGTGAELEDVVYMVFDPDNFHGYALNGRWKEVRSIHPAMRLNDPQMARTQTVDGFVASLHPERSARKAQAAIDQELLNKHRRISELDKEIAATQERLTQKEIERVTPKVRTEPVVYTDDQLKAAAEYTRNNGGGTFQADGLTPHESGGYAVATSQGTSELLPLGATDDEIAAAIRKVADENPNAENIGTWVNTNTADGPVGIHVDPSAVRAKRRDAEILAQQTDQIAIFDLNKFEDILTPTEPITAIYGRSGEYRRLVKERDRLIKQTSTRAAKARADEVLAKTVNPGRVTFVEGAESSIEHFRVRLDESIEGNLDSLPPGEIEKLYALEADMRLTGTYVDRNGNLVDSTNYRLKRLPDQATPYRGEQVESEAYRAMTAGRLAAEDGWRTFTTSKLAQGQALLFGRVYAVEMQSQMRQEIYNELLNKGAEVGEVNRFLRALQGQWEEQFSVLGAKMFRSADMLTPGKINKLARGGIHDSLVFHEGFNPKVIENVPDFADALQRASSRFYRNLAKKYPAQEGRGILGELIETFYGKRQGRGAGVAKVGRRGAYAGSVAYNILRFILDPRWYLMNTFESDILGMARWGSKVRGVMGGKARNTGLIGHMKGKDPSVPRDPFVERMSARRKNAELLSVDEILHANAGASGWMDPRNLYGYVAEAAKVERPFITKRMFDEMIESGSPVIDDLRARWGDNPQSWYDEVDELLYSIDRKGARRTVLDNELAQIMKNDPVMREKYEEFLTGLWQQHRQMFKDITHTFHGNVNRSNIERLLNSPLLWWPISYQLKTGKWLIDVMTKSFAGRFGAELAGTAAIGKLISNHQWSMENNDEYRAMFDEHPALFRALSMMLPITPFDMGVFMARWTRYAGSWTGAQLGLWDQDPSYPQDPLNFAARSLALGPIYSWDIFSDIADELTEDEAPSKFKKSPPKFK